MQRKIEDIIDSTRILFVKIKRPIKIWIIDDMPAHIYVMHHILKQWGQLIENSITVYSFLPNEIPKDFTDVDIILLDEDLDMDYFTICGNDVENQLKESGFRGQIACISCRPVERYEGSWLHFDRKANMPFSLEDCREFVIWMKKILASQKLT